jgi:hypothetical protein
VSNALALAGVTAVLRDLLDSGIIENKVTDAMGAGVTVSALPPDSIKLDDATAKPRLNLFLHQVTPNAGWRNAGYPTHDAAGRRIGAVPLALDLHYLLTAYGQSELQAEVLLGYAMQLLHETPVLAREAIRLSLNPPNPPVTGTTLPSVYQALRASDLADQIELIKISPETMNTEELSKLWAALQAHYRPTATYQVSVVLIDGRRPRRSTLPVLTRGGWDPALNREGGPTVQASLVSPFPQIEDIVLPSQRSAAHLGDIVALQGDNLDGTAHALRLMLPRLSAVQTVSTAIEATAARVRFFLPSDPAILPAGLYTVAVELVRPGETAVRQTNQLALPIAPQITVLPSPLALDADGNLTVTPTCIPTLRPSQVVSLMLGGREAVAEPFSAPTGTPTFKFTALPPGSYRARMRVDGVDSVTIDRTTTPPSFTGPTLVVTP